MNERYLTLSLSLSPSVCQAAVKQETGIQNKVYLLIMWHDQVIEIHWMWAVICGVVWCYSSLYQSFLSLRGATVAVEMSASGLHLHASFASAGCWCWLGSLTMLTMGPLSRFTLDFYSDKYWLKLNWHQQDKTQAGLTIIKGVILIFHWLTLTVKNWSGLRWSHQKGEKLTRSHCFVGHDLKELELQWNSSNIP